MTERLTTERIVEIAGKLGPERIMEILDTGATERELIEARYVAQQQEWVYADRPGVRTEVVHRLYDVLRADLIDPQER
jgi:hypothetical protein